MSEDRVPYLTDRPEETGDIDNLDEDFPVPSFEGPDGEIQPATIQDEMAAERHLKAISYYQHEAKYVHDHAAAHRARIDAWEQARLRPMLGRIVWHEGGSRFGECPSGVTLRDVRGAHVEGGIHGVSPVVGGIASK